MLSDLLWFKAAIPCLEDMPAPVHLIADNGYDSTALRPKRGPLLCSPVPYSSRRMVGPMSPNPSTPRQDRFAAIRSESPTFGVWQTIPSRVSAETLARIGYDWILIDLQHGEAGWNDLLGIVQAIELGGSLPFVRVAWNDPMQIMRALDTGAAGIVVPMISSPEDAKSAASAMHYPPIGSRSFGPIRNFYDTSQTEDQALCFAMIETAEGLANVDAIAATAGIDGLFVGTIDLALSLGCDRIGALNEATHAAIDRVIESCTKHGKISGGVAMAEGSAEVLIAKGMRFLTVGADIGFLNFSAKQRILEMSRFKTE